ncbi:ribosome-associated GTPase EngA [Owenweeksia hongkongensis DSM 17368]|uniref:GTPase Der n=1 Tax=Owenweeksia hongkongensis (strain DSM 17368 / CIP 108786 / JCM 12287 / NRRL B-23963 / UST20020801) TaxID=926562 RepID=G8R0S3_OWEHD|nr:ribosome-associated GTPase EngA [Owenweeksia hongkongensis DSM 17368]
MQAKINEVANIVAIVGRPNVGKSTLFNRLTKTRTAIVDSVAGVTRDRIYGKFDWVGRDFSVIDTGGYVRGSDDVFEGEIRKQVEIAIEEANIILFLVDTEQGVTGMDQEVAMLLRKSKKPVILVANKVDNSMRQTQSAEFYSLGLGEIFNISAMNGSGTGELLDEVVKQVPEDVEVEDLDIPKIAIVGRPNAGKSSFINALTGEERNIVTEIAGTTRDSIHTRYNLFGKDFLLVDTAGLRKKTKVHENLEFYSVMRSVRTIENSDVCVLLLDATRGLESQDLSIFSLAEKNKKGIVILVNKWDLVEKETNTAKEYKNKILQRLEPFTDIPIIFVSVLNKQRIFQAVEEAMNVYSRREQRIATSKLNDTMLPIIEGNPPPASKGKYVKIKFVTQLPTRTPSFAFFANLPQYVKEPYKRFIENKLREQFDFTGVPIQVYFRQK